jgi:hypothetical protein
MKRWYPTGTAGTLQDALDYLRSVYLDPLEPTSVRMRAASIAIEYERPRLAVTALVDGQDFASRLQRALDRSDRVRNGEVPTNRMIEAKAVKSIRRL